MKTLKSFEHYMRKLARYMIKMCDKRYKESDPLPGPCFMNLLCGIKKDYQNKWDKFDWKVGISADLFYQIFGGEKPLSKEIKQKITV